MFDENNDGIGDQPIAEVDKTTENNEATLDGIPEEDEKLGGEEEKPKIDRSEVAQKIRYRDKFQKAQDRIRELETKLTAKEQRGETTQVEEKELAAQRYIRQQAREEYEALKMEEAAKNEAKLEKFQDQLDDVMDANPDLTESQLLDICEEFEVEPAVAAKILKRVGQPKAKRSPLPSSKRASAEIAEQTPSEDKDKHKTLFEIAQEVKRTLLKK
jgi:hypothetical protein